jgi:diguanylate cyclase (GGDEF)-like protein/PAS domain S-box-containing protein
MERTRTRLDEAVLAGIEERRLAALGSYEIMDSAPDERFDALTRAAADIAEVPTALISLLDANRQWFLSRQQMALCETGRDVAFCDYVVRSRQEMTIEDATADERFAQNPLVTGEPHIRFYAGFPLLAAGGSVIGTLCVIGYEPKSLTDRQVRLLRTLADQVLAQLDHRRQLLEVEAQLKRMTRLRIAETAAAEQLTEARWQARSDRDLLFAVLDSIDVGVIAADVSGKLTVVNNAALGFGVADQGAAAGEWLPGLEVFREDTEIPLTIGERPLERSLVAPAGEGTIDGVRVSLGRAGPDRRLLRMNVRQLLDRDGSVMGAVAATTDITAATKAERALQAAHDQLTQALDAMPRAVTLVSVDRDASGEPVNLRVSWINKHVQKLIGRSQAQVAGRLFASVFPAVAAEYEQLYLDVARTGEALHRSVEWFQGDVVKGFFDVTVVPWTTDGLLIDAADVTARRLAERALESSEQRLRDAQTLAGLGAWQRDFAAGTLELSPHTFELLGLDPAITPTPALMNDLVHPEDREVFRQHFGDAERSDVESTTLDFRVVRPDGEVIWIRAHTTFERDPVGTVIQSWGTHQDITPARTKEHELTAAADTDPLTGLLNRRGWDAQTGAMIAGHRALPIAVAMIDLDHFKVLNDTEGHAAGDALLRACARAWQQRLRAADVVARIGGEEFALLLPMCDLAAAHRLVDRLRAAVPGQVTASAGITVLGDDEELDVALARADRGLYEAKRAGRNRVTTVPAGPEPVPAV